MTTAAPTPDDVLAKVDTLGPPGTPVTTPEVAEGFDCTKRTIYNRLDSLAEDGVLQTKKVGANSRVWWRPARTRTQPLASAQPAAASISNGDGLSTIHADGEMAERIRNYEWAETSLGPMEEWPSELRVAVDIMLGASEAIGIYWGDDLVVLYNDPAREQLGPKHPDALGRPARDVFSEAWEMLGPIHEQVMAGDGPVRLEEEYLPLERNGETDIWWDSSFTPLPAGDGSVGGVLNVSVDVTDRVLAERNFHETNEHLEVALNAAGMGTWEWDLDERTVRGDEQMLSLFDLPPTDDPVPVARFLEKESDIGVAQAEDAMEDSFEPGEEIQDEFYLEHADPPRWITWRGRAAEDDPSVLHGVSFDITERKQAEMEREKAIEALRESEENYHSLFEEMDEGFALCELVRDADGRIDGIRYDELNDAFEELTGVSRTEAEGRLVSEVFPEQAPFFLETFERVAETGERERVENYVPANDRWYEVRIFRREEDTVAVLYDDITERKEDELHREERYRTLFESINEGFCIVEVLFDEEGEQEDYRFLATNPAFEEITGLTDVDGELRRGLEDGYDPQFFNLYGEVARTGESKRFEASGEPLIEGWYDIRAFPYGEQDGNKVALLIEDITERKEAEQQLRESEATLSAILEQLPLGAGMLNADGVYEIENDRMREYLDGNLLPSRDPEKQVEWHATDDAGDPLPPEEWPGARALRGERVTPGIEFRREQDGETRWFNVAGVPLDGPWEEPKAVGVVQDITERKRREERQQFMRALDDALRPLADPVEVKQTASRMVSEHLDLDRAGYAELNPDGDTMTVERDWTRTGVSSMTGKFDSVAFGTIFTGLYDGETTTVEDSRTEVELSEETYERTWGAIGARAAIAAPVLKQGEFVAAFYVHSVDPRQWSDAEISIIEHVAERTWEAVERARAEQRLSASNRSLERLNDVSRELIDADPETIRDRVAELTVDVLGVDYAALWQYDGRTGEIEPFSEHANPETDLDLTRLSEGSRERVWETFIDDEITVEHAHEIDDDDGWPSELESRVFVPLGRHGVIIAGTLAAETFDDRRLDLVTMVAQTVETAWDRADSEQELALRNEELTRLDRLNTLMREIDQSLVAADTRAEIDTAVCEHMADSELYEFAWIGEHDPGTGLIEPRAWAGVDSGYLEELSITVEDTPTNRDPIARAIRTGELQVVADIATDSGFAPWREATLERGARSVVCIPLVYDDTIYGVLVVYADSPQLEADERNQDVLSELGATIAHTINARETRATLQTDSVVELTLRFEDCETPLCRLAREADCQIEYQGFVPRSSGHADVFFIAREVDPADLEAAADGLLAFEDVHCLTERSDGSLYRARISDPTLARRLTDAGAVVRSLTIDAAVATVVVDIPHTAAVREFLDDFRQRNVNFELLARQSRERPLKTRQTFVAALEDRLTDRQREVLQTAYLSGFFEVPRVSNGQEVTELLGVSQPTFSEHLRTAQRRLCEVLFEDVSAGESVDSNTAS